MGKPFGAIFWNVWSENQLSQARTRLLCNKFDEIIKTHNPDVMGLNEVVADEPGGSSALLKHLEAQGYQTFFAPFSPEKNGKFSGSAIVSRAKPEQIQLHELGPDNYGAVNGYPGHTIKLIQASVPHGKHRINIVVNYLAHLVPYNWAMHVKHHKAFRKIMRRPDLQKFTIIGGDFNQFKFIPWMWRSRRHYHRATGNFFHPTWKWLGKLPLIQANYDNIFWTKCGNIRLKEFEVLDRTPSDHAPLFASFNVHSGK